MKNLEALNMPVQQIDDNLNKALELDDIGTIFVI